MHLNTMEFRRRICYSLTLFYLLNMVDFVWSSGCSNPPKCNQGKILKGCECVPCPSDRYMVVRSGHQKCEFCTQPCSAGRHLVQIKNCTANSNRECHCNRGYYCESRAQYTCRRCLACPEGTFLNSTSRMAKCMNHTDCGSLGMALILRGNTTHDHVCAHVSARHAAREQNPVFKKTTAALSIVSKKTFGLTETTLTGVGPNISPVEQSTHNTLRHLPTSVDQLGVWNATKQNPVVKETTVPSSTVSTKSLTLEPETVAHLRGTQASPHQHSENSLFWPLMLVVIILVLILGFVKCYKNLASRKKCLPAMIKARPVQWGALTNPATLETLKNLVSEELPNPRALHPLDSKKGEGLGLDGVKAGPWGLQQVTVDHSNGRENVNNTVGSIFIYSPGTVILGSSASDQKGEDEEQPEDKVKSPEEVSAVTNAPQQESLEDNRHLLLEDRGLRGDCVRGCVEEAEKKELCYPIPATGK